MWGDGRSTHKTPSAKMPATDIFIWMLIFECQIIATGSNAHNQSDTIVIAENAYPRVSICVAAIQLPPLMLLSHAYRTGWHWKTMMKKVTMLQIETMAMVAQRMMM